MELFVFESETREGLCAFAAEKAGARLPERHGPWKAVAGQAPRLSKANQAAVERAVESEGFQLWRRP